MIRIGLSPQEKLSAIDCYCAARDVDKVIIISPGKFVLPSFAGSVPIESVEWDDVIRYKFFYRLLREIDCRTLVVVNECLRTQERSCLTYNCVRHYLQQAGHQIVFQYLPLIDSIEDLMILLDFDTRSRWRREKFSRRLLAEVDIVVCPTSPTIKSIPVETTVKERAAYARDRDKLFADLGLKDPHTIPRTLHLASGKAKVKQIDPSSQYVGRNNRFKLPNMMTYKEEQYSPGHRVVFEFPHNFIDFSDFLCLTGQIEIGAMVCDLKVDKWYFERYLAWSGRLRDGIAALS